MKPATRQTLFRIVLAIHFFNVGMATIARQALPKKYKQPYCHPYKYWKMHRISAAMLVVLHNNMVAAQKISIGRGNKIGDTFQIRRPARYAGRFA